ncbi:Rsm1-like-domain-containing protein [Staphylotrichum tortipilum]|uniref:Rsm1-like-domain-containing protein n=1 Tax=Staphylotrichum tortipilum TaxID=2831512 RepID=A0AAN6RSV8_9PEZI|nr:Rsm1-like-domain-containing protein [Staphylotrichum longicolle]
MEALPCTTIDIQLFTVELDRFNTIFPRTATTMLLTTLLPALALSLLGWQSLTHPLLGHSVPNSASCHTCLRRLGLWMFSPREAPDGARLVPPPMDHLDALREHRFFCPWKNPAVQRNPGSATGKLEREMAAWEVLVVGLRNEAFIREKVAGTGTPGQKGTAHGRSKSSVPPGRGNSTTGGRPGAVPKTPERPTTVSGPAPARGLGGEEEGDGEEGVEDGEEARRKKDVDMMSRLRRVKSLFNTKGGKLKRMGSRPGTSHSSVGPE